MAAQTSNIPSHPRLHGLLALLVVLGIACIWLSASYQLGNSRASHLREAEQSAEFQAQAFAENTLSTIKRLNGTLIDLRTHWTGDPAAFATEVRRRYEYLNDIAFQVAVIDADGWLAYSNLSSPKDRLDLSEREHFKVHRAGGDRLYISKPVKGKVSGKWSIQFTRPILAGGQFRGVLVISVSPDLLASFSEKLHAATINTLVAGSGEIMARHPDGEQAMGTKLSGVPYLLPDSPLAGHFTRQAQVDGVERIYGYYRVPEHDLTFVIGYPMAQVLAPYGRHRNNVLTAAAGISLFFAVLIGLLIRSLVLRADVERRLRDSQAMLRSAVDAIGEGFVIYDRDDRLAYFNAQYRDYYRASADLLEPGRSFEEIIRIGAERGQYRDAVGREEEWVAERLRLHRQGHNELIQRLDDGRWLRIRERKTPEGFIVGFRIDITELYLAKEAAEAANLAKSRFLATMSHEIRTPLNGILGMAQLLLMPDLPEHERNEFARIILNSGQTLLTLLNDLLDLSKIEAGKIELHDVVFDPLCLAEETAAVFTGQVKEKGLDVQTRWQGQPGARYRADGTRLRQMLGNLFGNAVKFTERGFVHIEISEISRDESGARLEFSVSDSGIGIAPEKQGLLFQPFAQADDSTTRQYGGTGLGLSIVRQLAGLMGGEAGLESQPGQGSRFWFRVRAEVVAAGEECRRSSRPAV